jgi:hypothetical protein
MKSNESKFQKCRAALLRQGYAAWMLLRKCVLRHSRSGEVRPNTVPEEPSAPSLNSLDRITEHLRHHGLGQQVHVRFEANGGGFVLEDADGVVHAKDYGEAVVRIERIWLYQP